ncbi:MAG TPA: MFS transporter [Longimicrobiaceae bacterium]|nr:MFS transporter [Longimicrobiaceae bacterium]
MTLPWWPTGGLWRHPDFLRLWAAQAASAFGSRITRTALPILAILTVGATPTEVAVLSALGVAPGVVVGLWAGGRVDRTARRPLLVGADLVRALLILTIPAAAWLGVLSMPQLYAVAAAVGAATTLFQIADNSFLPALVGRDQLVEGNARLEATDSIAEAAGPGIAGVLVQWLTAPVALAVDALTYLWSALLLSRIRAREAPPAPVGPAASVLGDVRAGFRACLAHPLVGRLLLAEAVTYLFGGFFLALYMVLALETLRLSPAAAGLVISVGGVGAFAGALLAAPLGRALGTGRALAVSLAVGQAANLLVPLAAHAGRWAVPLLATQQLVGDAFLGAYIVHTVSLRQRELPESVLGRANATFHVVTGALLPSGALLAGSLASTLGITATLWVGAAGGLLAPLLLAGGISRTDRIVAIGWNGA